MKKTGKRIIGLIVLLLVIVLLKGSMVSTYNDEYKLILQFGKVVRWWRHRVSALRSRFFRQHSRFLIMR